MHENFNCADERRFVNPILVLHLEVLKEVVNTIGVRRAESGGAIGGNGNGTIVSHFHFDEGSRNSSVTYSPDYLQLNQIFKGAWNPDGVRLKGFVHSHPGHMSRPSIGDEVYAGQILKAIKDLECLWLPIVNTVPDTGGFSLTPWVAYPSDRGVSMVKGRVVIVPGSSEQLLEMLEENIIGERVSEAITFCRPLDEILIGGTVGVAPHSVRNALPTVLDGETTDPLGQETRQNTEAPPSASFDIKATFNRVEQAYDLKLMESGRLIAVGAGGAAGWLEDLARAGLGQFVLIDPDVVSDTNLATQQTYRRDIGRPKVDCISERIRDINPTATIIALQKKLDDLTDEDLRSLAHDPIDGCQFDRTIVCGLTDSFLAQARVNRIALQFGLPSLCAQVYKEGRGAEVTFTYPGVTPACHRCILSSRYRYFLEQHQVNDVTSHGTPIFSTTRLNAIKGFVVLAMFHYGSDHPRWGQMLSRIGKRNLIQVRMDPDIAKSVPIGSFDKVFQGADNERLFFDEAIWLPQDQECKKTGYRACPDCKGTGDLRDAIGTLTNTVLSPMEDQKAERDGLHQTKARRLRRRKPR